MIKLIPYAVRDAAGVVIRTGRCQNIEHLREALLPGETVDIATPADFQANEARLTALLEQARSFRDQAEPSETDVILEAIKAKLTPAELTAARQKLKAAKALHPP